MMNIIICDDDKKDLKMIEKFCKSKLTPNDNVFSYEDSKELVDVIQNNEISDVDVFVLDIEMPETSGLEIKALIEKTIIMTNVIFLTSHVEMMEKAFGRNVIAFINKNGWEERLEEELRKIQKSCEDKITIQLSEGLLKLKMKQIIAIQAANYYSEILYVDGELSGQKEKTVLCKKSLKKWELELEGTSFYRISRIVIINFENVRECRGDTFSMTDGRVYKVPRGKIKAVKKEYYNYIFEKKGAV